MEVGESLLQRRAMLAQRQLGDDILLAVLGARDELALQRLTRQQFDDLRAGLFKVTVVGAQFVRGHGPLWYAGLRHESLQTQKGR